MFKKTIEIIALLTAIGLLIVNIFQSRSTEKAAGAASDAVTHAQEQFRDDERAWVGTTERRLVKFERGDIAFRVTFTNTGKTPGRKVRFISNAAALPFRCNEPPPDKIKGLEEEPPNQLGSIAPQGAEPVAIGNPPPGENTPMWVQDIIRTIMVDDFDQIKSGKLLLYIYGELRYEDVFNRPHVTQFCMFLQDPKTGVIGNCPGFNEIY